VAEEAIHPADATGSAGAIPIGELDLYHLAWDTPEFSADPYGPCEAARAQHPWLAKSDAGYVVHDLTAIRELLVKDDKLRTSFDGIVDIMQARGTAWGRFAEEQMIALPDKEHRLLRDAFAAKFTPRYANELRPLMRETMTQLLEQWVPKGRIDFEEFSSYYPVSVMTRMIGAPLEVIPELRSAMETLGLAFSLNSAMVPELDKAMAQFDIFAFNLIEERRANPRTGQAPDLLDLLLEAGDHDGITERQLADLLIFLFVAGYDTSKNVLTYTMDLMLRNPEIYERCAQDADYCQKALEEALRMFTPASTFRATREDMVYRGVLIPKDTMLFFLLNVAGRISADIEEPHAFKPERAISPQLRHAGFGLGRHMCLGQFIARAQLQEGLHLIAQHMRNPRLAGEPGWRPFPGVWGIKGLPIEFDPVAVQPAGEAY
jgi:cytochrome P450